MFQCNLRRLPIKESYRLKSYVVSALCESLCIDMSRLRVFTVGQRNNPLKACVICERAV